MSIMIFCDNKISEDKRCGKESAAVLKMEDKKEPEDCQVFCTECGLELKNVNKFTKRNLYFSKQVQQTSQPGEAYAMHCVKCQNSRRPLVKDKKLYCQSCSAEMTNVSEFYKNLLFSQMSSGR